jgi:transcriptional regulator with XRE-family HTH domain
MILNYYRAKSNISMATHAKDICSKHYIYLIEHGQRVPSVKMIDELSARLNFDWREYVDFADNPSPIQSKQLIDDFNECAKSFQFERLSNLLESLPDEEWIHCYPVDKEIVLQKIIVCVFHKKDRYESCKDVISYFKESVKQIISEPNYSMLSLLDLRYLNLYALLLVKENKADEAYKLYNRLYVSVQEKVEIKRYQSLYINVSHGLLNCCSVIGNYKLMNSYGVKLLSFQEEQCLLSKAPLTLILIGDSYKYIGKKTIAYRFYKRALTVSKIIKNNYLINKAEKKIDILY